MINIQKSFRSFRYAWAGIINLFRYENNARVHLLLAIVVIGVGLFFDITATEWGLVVLAIVGVWAAEAFNTAIEKLCDLVEPKQNSQIKIIKDLAAAAVLITAIGAVIVGLLVFGVRVMDLIAAL